MIWARLAWGAVGWSGDAAKGPLVALPEEGPLEEDPPLAPPAKLEGNRLLFVFSEVANIGAVLLTWD